RRPSEVRRATCGPSVPSRLLLLTRRGAADSFSHSHQLAEVVERIMRIGQNFLGSPSMVGFAPERDDARHCGVVHHPIPRVAVVPTPPVPALRPFLAAVTGIGQTTVNPKR